MSTKALCEVVASVAISAVVAIAASFFALGTLSPSYFLVLFLLALMGSVAGFLIGQHIVARVNRHP